MEFQVKKVDNGWVVQLTKWDYVTGKPEVSVTIHKDLESVVEYMKNA